MVGKGSFWLKQRRGLHQVKRRRGCYLTWQGAGTGEVARDLQSCGREDGCFDAQCSECRHSVHPAVCDMVRSTPVTDRWCHCL